MPRRAKQTWGETRQTREQWNQFGIAIGHEWYRQVVIAEANGMPGWEVAIHIAQGLKRGLRHRFGLEVKVYRQFNERRTQGHLVFKSAALPPRFKPAVESLNTRTEEDLFNCSLSVHLFQCACEMIAVCGVLLPEMREKGNFNLKSAMDTLAFAWAKYVDGFYPAYTFLFLKRLGQKEDALRFMTEYVRCGLKTTVPSGKARGEWRAWVQAVRSVHPDVPGKQPEPLEVKIVQELPTAVALALNEVPSPTRLHSLFSKTEKHLEALKPQADDTQFTDDVLNSLAVFRAQQTAAAQTWVASAYERLTPRQCDIADLLGEGINQDTIALKLNLSASTVSRDVTKIEEAFAQAS